MYEAVKHFYPYLDGCANLRIETDCSTIMSMFVYKPEMDADQIVQFWLGLTKLGSDNIMYMINYLSDSKSTGGEAANITDSKQQLAILAQAVHPDLQADYWDCQLMDTEIQAWIELCKQHDTAADPTTPEYRVVEKKQLVNHRLYYMANMSDKDDTVGTLAPVLTCSAMCSYAKQVHSKLAHAGAHCLLGFVKMQAWCPGLDNVIMNACQQ
ncbi:hypothetical protein IWW56_005699 [Coemansia sp. RSA 2131]|nr:hypothetical protein IWW56_005699 [Coemansia sp. RSA 2131]